MGLPVRRWCWPRTRTTCWKSSSAPASTVRVRPSRPTPRPARPWTFRAHPTSSASCSIWWAATRPACRRCGPAWLRRRLRPVGAQARVRIATASCRAPAPHADRLATIRSVYDESGVLVDPHTADGVKVAREFVEPGVPMLVLETALPAKFSETIEGALGRPAVPPGNLADLESLPQRVEVMDCDAAAVCGATSGPRQDVMPDAASPVMAACGMGSPENPHGRVPRVFGVSPGKRPGDAAVPGRRTDITFVCIFATSRHRLSVFGTVE